MFDAGDAGGAADGTADPGAAAAGATGGLAACAPGLSAAVDELLAVDTDAVSDGELAEAMVGLRREQARLAAGVAELTAAFEVRQVHATDGARSAVDWIAARCRIPRGQAGREVREARRLRTMGSTRAAFRAGDLSPAHVSALCRLAGHPRASEHFGDGEDGLVDHARVTVMIDYPTLAGRVCELAGSGTVVPPGDITQLLAEDATLMERVVSDGPNRVIDISSARNFRGTLRRILDLIHRRCNDDTCFVPASHCEGDHIQPWSEGGATSQDNGGLGCGWHNRLWFRRPDLRPSAHQLTLGLSDGDPPTEPPNRTDGSPDAATADGHPGAAPNPLRSDGLPDAASGGLRPDSPRAGPLGESYGQPAAAPDGPTADETHDSSDNGPPGIDPPASHEARAIWSRCPTPDQPPGGPPAAA